MVYNIEDFNNIDFSRDSITTSKPKNPAESGNEAILSSSDGFTAFNGLYIDSETFLKPIKKVRIVYDA